MRTEKLPKERFRVYLARAAECRDMMDAAEAQEKWHAVGITAVHAVISAADALTTFYLGERSRGDGHADVAALVGRLPLRDAAAKVDTLVEVVSLKNQVEYEAVGVSERQARDMKKRAERFFSWAKANLP